MFLFPTKKEKIASWAAKGKQTEKLCEMCFDLDPEIRALAAAAVGNTKGDRGYNCLINLLRDDEIEVQMAAAKALDMMGSKNAIEHLRYAAAHTDNAEFKQLCLNTVANLLAKIKE